MPIRIIGTSHVAKESVEEIRAALVRYNPDIIAVELDRERLGALLSDRREKPRMRDIKHFGIQGYLFLVIGGYIQKRLGDVVDMKPGSDMLEAVRIAEKQKLKLELIDQSMRITLKRFSQSFRWRDKWHLLVDAIKSPFSEKQKIDLSKVPPVEMVSMLIGMLKDRYPGAYKALIQERNEHMVSRLKALQLRYPDAMILAIVGAGHKEGMLSLLDMQEPAITYTISYDVDST